MKWSLGDFVYGATDGAVTTLAIAAGVGAAIALGRRKLHLLVPNEPLTPPLFMSISVHCMTLQSDNISTKIIQQITT